MKAIVEQFIASFRAMPTSKKISMAAVLALVITALAIMFLWANQVDYQLLYSNLSAKDAANIVAKLKEQRVPYRVVDDGSTILVAGEKVHELRLALASDGLPTGGHVGFEIFDKTDFSTSEYVQKLNYQRALQGELARTISEFQEVEDARVHVVMPKDSLFVEDSRPPSASVLLKLRGSLSQNKVAGIVHLVASAVEGLEPERVTVVDTSGKVLFKGPDQEDQAALLSSNKLDYQRQVEAKIAGRIQTMLEGIVGEGKAIVRVSADIDFDQVDFSEEKYDPDSSVIRSRQHRSELSEKGGGGASAATAVNRSGGAVPAGEAKAKFKSLKEDEVLNYEINRIMRHVVKPWGTVKCLSVATVVDGTYETVKAPDGTKTRKYIPRSEEELRKFENIVKRAMGFDADRGDQVYVSSFPFSASPVTELTGKSIGTDWLAFARQHVRTAVNIVLIMLVFFFVVRPLIKSLKEVRPSVENSKDLLVSENRSESAALPGSEMSIREKAVILAKNNTERTEQVLRGWLTEGE